MISIISACLPLLLRLIGMFIDSGKASKEQKEAYNAFVLTMQKEQTASAELNQSFESQTERLKKEIESQNGGQQ